MIRGIICAGGSATRLGELTKPVGGTNKHLLPVGPLPMIYYPLRTLNQAGLGVFCIVTGWEHTGGFTELLGNGQIWSRSDIRGVESEKIFSLDITYRVQARPGGIAEAIGLAKGFASGDPVIVMLGDNIIQGNIIRDFRQFADNPDRALIMLKEVPNPQDYGVAERDHEGKIISIIEKPSHPTSNFAVIGIYMYPADVFEIIKSLRPSARGELEVTDINLEYLRQGRLDYRILRGWWRDAGREPRSLSDIGVLIFETGANDPNL